MVTIRALRGSSRSMPSAQANRRQSRFASDPKGTSTEPTLAPRSHAQVPAVALVAPSSTVVQPSAVHTGLCDDPQETLDRLRSFANLDEDAEAEFDERFSEIIGV